MTVARTGLPLLLALALTGCSGDGDGSRHERPPAADAAVPAATGPTPPANASWVAPLAAAIERIDRDTPGALGVYLRRLDDGATLSHAGERPWYLASTVKVPVAIAVLEAVEEGRLALDEALELRRSDFVDGAGDLIWQEPGGRYPIATLLEKSLVHSDSTATDMLIRRLGEDELNRRIARWLPGGGFGPLTTILQVRYDAYGELHPGVAGLDNMDLVRLKNAEPGAARLEALRAQLGVPRSELAADSIDDAFERYYRSPRNSATLQAFATLLEKLVRRELLSEAHTGLLLGHMAAITTGRRRIQAGLPAGTPFAQKTGTQLARACNMGILRPDAPDAVVVAACVERFDALADAERALAELGRALSAAGLAGD